MSRTTRDITLIEVCKLRHIEDYGRKRVAWLKEKIINENNWTVPLKVETSNYLVMDGQHRMEVAKLLNLKYVPCLLYSYDEVDVWSLRDNHIVTAESVVKRALTENIYPYKTAKHAFPDGSDTSCSYTLDQLQG